MLRLAVFLCLALAAPAAAKPGDLDRTFAHRGSTAFAGGAGYTSASDVALRPDGSMLVAGNAQTRVADDWIAGSTLARLTAVGRVARRTFLSTPASLPDSFNPALERVAALPDGGALVASTLDWQSERPLIAVYRVRADGTPDPSFGANGVTIAGDRLYLAGMGVDGVGRIVLAATRPDGESAAVMRLLPDGTLDARYGVVSVGGGAGALLVQRDGSAFVATTRALPRSRVAIHALDADGRHRRRTVRLTLHDKGRFDARVTALARGAHGTLLVAGVDAGRHQYGWVARLRSDGSVDRRFGRRTIVSKHRDVSIQDMARDHRGRIVLVGDRSLYETPKTLVARLTPSGRRDRSFGPDGTVLLQIGSRAKTNLIASEANAVAIDARDRIVLAGAAYDDDAGIREDLGRSYFAVARLKG